MARKKQYSRQEVSDILQQSEGRKSPVSGEPGHTLKYHVGADGLQISDRLMNTLQTDDSHPLIMTPDGKIAPESVHRDVWKSRNPGMSTKKSKSDFRSMIDNHRSVRARSSTGRSGSRPRCPSFRWRPHWRRSNARARAASRRRWTSTFRRASPWRPFETGPRAHRKSFLPPPWKGESIRSASPRPR